MTVERESKDPKDIRFQGFLNTVFKPIELHQGQLGFPTSDWVNATSRLIAANLIIDTMTEIGAQSTHEVRAQLTSIAKTRRNEDQLRVLFDIAVDRVGQQLEQRLLNKVEKFLDENST